MKVGIDTVVFDLGHVLFDWDPRFLYRKLFRNEPEMERFLSEVVTREWHLGMDGGRQSYAEGVARLSARFPEHAMLIEAYNRRWDEMVGAEDAEAVAILRSLRTEGVPLYALSNGSMEKFPVLQRKFAWLAWFEGVVVSSAVGLLKPDPAIYTLLLDRFGLTASQCFFIDDQEPNVVAARKVGMQAARYTNPAALRSELERLALL